MKIRIEMDAPETCVECPFYSCYIMNDMGASVSCPDCWMGYMKDYYNETYGQNYKDKKFQHCRLFEYAIANFEKTT